MQQRPLAAGVKAHPVRGRVEQPEERRDEAVGRQIVDQLVVDVRVHLVEASAQTQADADHRANLGGRERRSDSMPRRVTEQQEQATVGQPDEVEQVAPGLVGRAEQPRAVVALHLRHLLRQRRHLDLARDGDFPVELLGQQPRLGHLHAMQRDRALRGERRGHALVVPVEAAFVAVQDLQHADQLVLVADQRQAQHAARPVAALAVHLRVEARVLIAVRHVDQSARLGALAHDAPVRRYADRCEAGGHLEYELVRGRVVQEDAAALGVQDLARGVDHRREHGIQVVRRGKPPRDLEQLLELVRAQSRPRSPQARRSIARSSTSPRVHEREAGVLDVDPGDTRELAIHHVGADRGWPVRRHAP